jgi:DNA-directed RNA polymerase subunit RPC12/RpoP
MNIKIQEIKTFITSLYCDSCGTEVELEPGQFTDLVRRSYYIYKCPKCGDQITSSKQDDPYPKITYQRI